MRARVWFCSVLVLGCAPEAPSIVLDAPVSTAHQLPTRSCEPAECLRERAEVELAAGVLDRASALLGRAYALEPSDAAFERWVGSLLSSGQRRRAAVALAQARNEGRHAALVDELEAQLQRIEVPAVDVAALVDRGELAWSRGELEAARRAWSQARIALDQREAQLSLVADYRWSPTTMRWADWRLELIDFVEIGDRELAFVHGLELDLSDTPRESPSRVIPREALAKSSEPDSDHPLVIGSRRVELFGADGRRRAKIVVTGSEKKNIEVCDGRVMRSEVIEVPFEVSAAIVDEALRHLIVATSDGRIVVRDLESKQERILQIEGQPGRLWLSEAEPRDVALALRVERGELLALTSHAELWRWRLADGALLDRRDSRCVSADWSQFSPTGEYAVQVNWRVSLCSWRARDGVLEPVDLDVDPIAVAFDPDQRPTVLDDEGRVFMWSEGALRGPIEVGSSVASRPLAKSVDRSHRDARAPRLSPDGCWLAWPDPRSPTSWLRWDLVDGGPPMLLDASQQELSADRQRLAVDLGDAVEVRRGGELERRFEFGSVLRFTLLGAGGRLLVVDDARNSERFFVHDLERGQQWWIERAPRGTLGYQASDDGTRLARHEQGGRIAVWDLGGDTPVLRTTFEDADWFALAASGRTLVWFVAQGSGGTLQSVDLEHPDAEVRGLELARAPVTFTIAPNGDEVAVGDRDELLRWRPETGAQTRHAWPRELHFVDHLQFAADGRHLIASKQERVYVLSEASEIEATIERLDQHWLVTTPSGVVDGSWGVHRELLAVVEDDAYAGSLAWDRFEVRGLLALLLTGQGVEPW